MAALAADKKTKSELLALLRLVPAGSVATIDLISKRLHAVPALVVTLLVSLTEDERETTPWHRVVAKGGAIGRGPHRDQQFARLVREGVPVSPAGIVQDMDRVAVTALEGQIPSASTWHDSALPAAPLSRSRGMKDRPA